MAAVLKYQHFINEIEQVKVGAEFEGFQYELFYRERVEVGFGKRVRVVFGERIEVVHIGASFLDKALVFCGLM